MAGVIQHIQRAVGVGSKRAPGTDDDFVPAIPVDIADGRFPLDRHIPGVVLPQPRPIAAICLDLAVQGADDDITAAVLVDVSESDRRALNTRAIEGYGKTGMRAGSSRHADLPRGPRATHEAGGRGD